MLLLHSHCPFMPIVQSRFAASPALLANPHLQTVLASKVFKPVQLSTVRERIELPDGDFLDINSAEQPQRDIVLIFHGLAGCVDSPYIQGVFRSLIKHQFMPVLMHWRGCSGEPNRLARSYHSGASDDIGWFVNAMAQRHPDANLYAVGYSLGGNALLKYLGETGSASKLAGAMAVSPPLVLQEGAKRLNQGVSRVYQRYLLGRMRRHHELKRKRYPHLELPAAGPDLDTFWKFDDHLTAPLHGYQGVHDYYTRCSARQFLPAIETPARILSAQDDPFFTPDILPGASELARDTTLEVSTNGGHVGFLQGRRRWLDEHVALSLANFRAGDN